VQAGGSGLYTDTLARLHQFLPLQDYLAFYLAYQNKDMEKPTCEEKFIAHGGGKIDGYIYTNALDALDFSYKQGARLFELDFIETSDGKLVAAHDWKHYKTITNYSGSVDDVPLSEAEFLSQRIYGKFTPLHMGRINTRFAQHEDAILITDKINDPKKLAEHFVFTDRVIMELFSRDAVETALKI
jgi:glycerophosphoryl diester phosphodiesterase